MRIRFSFLLALAVSGFLSSPVLAQKPAAGAAAAKPADTAAAPVAPPPQTTQQSVVQQFPSEPVKKASDKSAGKKSTAISNPPPALTPVVHLILYVGEVKTLPVVGVTRVAVGNGKMVSSTVLDDEVLLLAEAPGDSSLYLWLTDGSVQRYKITVHAIDTEQTLGYIRSLVGSIPGVTVEQVGGAVIVSGTASKQNLARIDAAVKNFPRSLNMVREEDVTMKKMVYMKVQIMEFKKSALQNLGVNWATNAAGPATALTADLISNRQFRYAPAQLDPSFTAGTGAASALSIPGQAGRMYFGIATTIASQLNLAMNNGDAWVLAAPELSTRSGGEAKFLAGGQIPIVTAGALGATTVTYKDYGIKLNIKPVADDDGNISASITTEVSDIDPSVQAVQGNPGFLMRATESELNVKSGQTIVISGLVNQRTSSSVNKFPWLGDVPVLGALFRSENFQNNRSDLVIFVTPVVADPASTTNQQRLEKAKDMRERFQDFLGKKGIVD